MVLVEEPTCTTALSVYACSRDVGSFDWDLVRDGGLLARVSFGSSFTPTGTIRNRQIESSMVTFNVTSASKNFLSVTTTINDTVSLNGVQMVCAGDTIIVEVRQSKLLEYLINTYVHVSISGGIFLPTIA